MYLHGGVGSLNLEPDSTWFEYLNFLPWMKMAEKEWEWEIKLSGNFLLTSQRL